MGNKIIPLMKFRNFTTLNKLPYLFTIILFIIPFFWLKPGEIDIGGDSSRLYFYDPMAFLKNVAWYGISTQGTGVIEPNYFYIPFVFFSLHSKNYYPIKLVCDFDNKRIKALSRLPRHIPHN